MIIVNGAYGQLANQLFTFANLIAFAEEHHQTVIHPAFLNYAGSFEYFKRNPGCTFPKTDAKRSFFSFLPPNVRTLRFFGKVIRRVYPSCSINYGEKDVLDLDDTNHPQTQRLASSALSIVSGFYLVGHHTFLKHAALVRDLFRPAKEISTTVDAVEREARRGVDLLVGVHGRQGDYRTFGKGLSFFSSGEYGEAMRRITTLFPEQRVRFMVCSNEDQKGQFTGLDVQFGPGDAVGDLYTLARCDYLLGPGSTFTQWASFYGSVPRYVMAWKWEQEHGLPLTPLTLGGFRVHISGFGSQTNRGVSVSSRNHNQMDFIT